MAKFEFITDKTHADFKEINDAFAMARNLFRIWQGEQIRRPGAKPDDIAQNFRERYEADFGSGPLPKESDGLVKYGDVDLRGAVMSASNEPFHFPDDPFGPVKP